MMRKLTSPTRLGLIALAVVCVNTLIVRAQDVRTLTLQESIEIALENNRDLRMTQLETGKADAEVDEALGNALPSVDLSANYTRNFKRPVFFFPGNDGIVRPIKIGSKNALSADLTLQQVVFNSAVFNGVGTSKIYAKISRQQLKSKASATVLDVKRAFYSALLAREVLGVNEALLTNAEANHKNTQALYESGLRSEFDAIRAEVAVENQRPAVVQARNQYEDAIDYLTLLLGTDGLEGDSLVLTGEFTEPGPGDPIEDNVDQAYSILTSNNPQLEALRLTSDVNKEFISINRSEYLPTLNLFGTYKYEAQADAFGDLDFQPSAFAGLNLSLNLYTGGQTSARVDKAQVDLEQSRFQLAQAREALRTQLVSTLRKMKYARDRVSASERTIEQAERAYSIATTQYQAGTGTQLQINDADLALAQARLNRLNAIYDFTIAHAELADLLGESVVLDGDDVRYAE